MIFEEEVPVLPPGVLLEGDFLLDTVMGAEVSLNGTARFLLSSIDGERTVREIAGAASRRYGIATEQVTSDFSQLTARLNEKFLLNLDASFRRRCTLLPGIFRLLIVGLLAGHVSAPWHRRRLEISNQSRLACSLCIVRRLGPRSWVIGSIIGLTTWMLVGAFSSSVWLFFATALASSVSLLVHEAAHAVALVPVPAFLGVYGPAIKVQHRPVTPRKGLLVSAAGPAITGGLGLSVLLGSDFLNSGALLLVGMMLLLNLLGMTVAAPDGRNALRNLALALESDEKDIAP
jgi:hypothetical protein